MRLIDANTLKDSLRPDLYEESDKWVLKTIDNAPTITPAAGEWKSLKDNEPPKGEGIILLVIDINRDFHILERLKSYKGELYWYIDNERYVDINKFFTHFAVIGGE